MWRTGADKSLDLTRPRLVAILNVTPDSFYVSSRVGGVGSAVERARAMVGEGADVLDIGAESTRPGAEPVPAREQIARAVPIIEAIRTAEAPLAEIPIAIDTTSAEVARAALDAGADAINDVSAGRDDPEMLELAASRGAGLILMHRAMPARRDSYSDRYHSPPMEGDVVEQVREFLEERAGEAIRAGVRHNSIVVDPGLGFGKTVEQNLELIRRTAELAGLGYPVLSALSRKSFVGRIALAADSEPEDRLAGTLAMSLEHVRAGARLLRVHDVAAHAQALRAAIAAGMPL